MIYHENGTFTFNRTLSFRLPDGMCLNNEAEGEMNDAFELISPDGSFRLSLAFISRENSARNYIEHLLQADHRNVQGIGFLQTKDVAGYHVDYVTTYEVYEEYVFDVPTEPHALLNIWFWHRKDQPYDVELYENVRTQLLDSIELV